MPWYLTSFAIVLSACFVTQTIALRDFGGRTVKSESNYFSSIARLQTEKQDYPHIMLLGSSMTARLADRAARVPGVANLGCDGGSAVVTLRAIDRGLLPAAPVIVVEANSLAFELEGRGKEISAAIDSEWFRLGCSVPNLGATARPTAFGYSWLMARKKTSSPPSSDLLPLSSKPMPLDQSNEPTLDAAASTLADEVSGILKRLKAKGRKVIIVMLPPGAGDALSVQARLPRAIASRSAVPWWDLNENLPPGAVGFSDGLHLDALGAQKVLNTLLRQIDSR